MKLLIHWFAHLLNWNGGKVLIWSESGNDMIGFRCSGCGKMTDIQKLPGVQNEKQT